MQNLIALYKALGGGWESAAAPAAFTAGGPGDGAPIKPCP